MIREEFGWKEQIQVSFVGKMYSTAQRWGISYRRHLRSFLVEIEEISQFQLLLITAGGFMVIEIHVVDNAKEYVAIDWPINDQL